MKIHLLGATYTLPCLGLCEYQPLCPVENLPLWYHFPKGGRVERVKIKTDLLMSAAPKLLLVRSKSATTGTSKAMHVQTITTIKSSLATFSTFSSKRSAMNSTTSSMSNVQIPAGGYQAVPYHFIHDLATKAARSGRPTMHPHCGFDSHLKWQR